MTRGKQEDYVNYVDETDFVFVTSYIVEMF
jgi:hypothetical protein